MKIETTRFGTLDIDSADRLQFPEGLLGFSHLREFILLNHKNGPFRWLQSIEDPDIAFVVLELGMVVDDYQLRLSKGDMELLQITSFEPDEVAVLSIVNVSSPRKPTANLLAPVCIAAESRCGIQVVQHHTGYSTRHPLRSAQRGERRKVA